MSGSSINNRVFSQSTIEALSKKVNKNQDENISVKEIKNSITDSKGNIDDSKLKSIGITNQEDIKKIKSEYKSFELDSKIVFQIPKDVKNNSSNEIKLNDENNSKKEFIHEILKNDPKQFKDIENKIKIIKNPENVKDFLNGVINILNKYKIKEQNKSLDNFHGKNPEAISILKNKGDEKKLSDDYIKEVKNFKGIHNINFTKNVGFIDKIYNETQNNFRIVGSNRSGLTDKLSTETKKEELEFRKLILNNKKNNLTPADLIKNALEVTKGDYHKAVLISNNVLKAVSHDLRDSIKMIDGGKNLFNSKAENYKKIGENVFSEDIKIVGKLSNLRSEAKNNTDKMGPWYHFFGVQLSCSRHGSDIANIETSIEHIGRNLPYIGTGTSKPDKEKANIDNLSINIFNKINSGLNISESYKNLYIDKGL
jgi:hypothetical protein